MSGLNLGAAERAFELANHDYLPVNRVMFTDIDGTIHKS